MLKKTALVLILLIPLLSLSGCKRTTEITDYFMHGLTLVEDKSYTDALSAFQQASEETPDNSAIYLEIAKIYRIKGLYDDAIETLDIGIENSPGKADLYLLKGEVLREQKKYEEAADAYSSAVKEGYEDDYPLFYTGITQIKSGEFKKAKSSFESISQPEELKKQSYYYLAVLTTEDVSKVLDHLKKTKGVENEDIKSNANSFTTILEEVQEKSKEEGVNEYYLKLLHGYGLIKIGEFEVAKTVVEEVADYYEEQGKPSYQANFYLGSIYYNLADYTKAIEELNTSIVANPTDPITLHLLGLSYTKTGNQVKALESFEKAIKLSPKNENARYDYISSLIHFKINSTAESQFEELINLETDRQPQYILEFAQFLNDKQSNASKALERTNYLIAEWSGFTTATRQTKAEIYDTHGWALYLTDEGSKSIDYLKEAIEQDEYLASAHYHLGKAYEKAEKYNEALESYARAIDLALDEELSTKAYQEFDRLNK